MPGSPALTAAQQHSLSSAVKVWEIQTEEDSRPSALQGKTTSESRCLPGLLCGWKRVLILLHRGPTSQGRKVVCGHFFRVTLPQRCAVKEVKTPPPPRVQSEHTQSCWSSGRWRSEENWASRLTREDALLICLEAS